jgi:hypothetical protein
MIKIELKSKSPAFQDLIKKIDEALNEIPLNDVDGVNIEESERFDDFVHNIKSIIKNTIPDHEPHLPNQLLEDLSSKFIYEHVENKRDEADAQSV